jgi:hypothetical protein
MYLPSGNPIECQSSVGQSELCIGNDATDGGQALTIRSKVLAVVQLVLTFPLWFLKKEPQKRLQSRKLTLLQYCKVYPAGIKAMIQYFC